MVSLVVVDVGASLSVVPSLVSSVPDVPSLVPLSLDPAASPVEEPEPVEVSFTVELSVVVLEGSGLPHASSPATATE
ncbi:hypothetical protein [Nannocystis pusilla]|uniref:hypothetical protein n=1 Tax=Nannocystis pusilla TaxID=889268 RepID=UPI003B81DD0F